jgi:non-heme chloroperoxidase
MRATTGVALTVGTAALGIYAAERYAVQRLGWNPDPTALDDFSRPRGRAQLVTCADGTQLATVSLGTGPTVVLSHGYTANLANWALVAPLLVKSGHQVVMFDQRGHGESTVGADGFGIEQLGSDLAAVLEQLQITDATVVGHSMGGIGLQSLLTHHSAGAARRVAGAVFLSAPSRGVGSIHSSSVKLNFLESRLFDRGRNNALHGLYFAQRAFGENPALSQVEAALELARACPLETVRGALVPLLNFDMTAELAEAAPISMVICGTNDTVTFPSGSQKLANVTGADLYWLDGAGHVTPFERYRRVAELIAVHSLAASRTAAVARENWVRART